MIDSLNNDLIHGPMISNNSQLTFAEVQVQDVYILESESSFIYLLYQIGNVFIKSCSGTTILLGLLLL
jgi:hypothetical protein